MSEHAVRRREISRLGSKTEKNDPKLSPAKKEPVVSVDQFALSAAWLQLRACVALFAGLGCLALAPGTSLYFRNFFLVAYRYPVGAGKGWADVALPITALIFYVALRAFVQIVVIRYWLPYTSIRSPKVRVRTAEQVWGLIYYTGNAVAGLWLLRYQDYGWDPHELWKDYPHYYISPAVKAYYLIALGYWMSQILTINIEARRSDHWQMFTHHIVTCFLISGSYAWSYTRIGHLTLILMDFVDIFLSAGKVTKYLRFPSILSDAIFLVFLVSWVALRHGVFIYQVWWGWHYAPRQISNQCATSWHSSTEQLSCFNMRAHAVFALLCLALQGIMVVWLVMIIKIATRVIKGGGAEDSRSEDEDDGDEDGIENLEVE